MMNKTIDLSGKWKFGTTSGQINEDFVLPGTTDENQKGQKCAEAFNNYLTRRYIYSGSAWYEREFEISPALEGRHIALFLERTRVCTVYLNDEKVGFCDRYSTPHRYSLGYLKAGKYKLKLCVDNSEDNCFAIGHSNTDNTQTNWNGILGRIELQATLAVRVEKLRVFPNIHTHEVKVVVSINNDLVEKQERTIELCAKSLNAEQEHKVEPQTFPINIPVGRSEIELLYDMTKDCLLWSEFEPNLYLLESSLDAETVSTEFAMREFKAEGKLFTINGKKTYLRGKHDACVFPLTGYAPMDLDSWMAYMDIMIEYGINHIRCHTWTLPEAAFRAADRKGLYIQAELPNWNVLLQAENGTTEDVVIDGFGRKETKTFDPENVTDAELYMEDEGLAILQEYGNYGSFTMFTLGNELCGNVEVMARLIDKYREANPDKMYAQGSNNYFYAPVLQPKDDFWVTMALGNCDHKTLEYRVRASFSYNEHASGGAINTLEPGTQYNYEEAIEPFSLPILGHENGQYQFFPDFDEIEKYTGVLDARNFKNSRDLMEKNGILPRWKDFFKASGRFSSILYKEDIEQAMRTKGFAGFQVLDLQDFPGQGTALVGILNAFLENKGHITAEEWRQFCDRVIVLARFDKYIWCEKECITAEIQLSNFSGSAICNQTLHWEVEGIASGEISIDTVPQGELSSLGSIQVNLPAIKSAQKTNLILKWDEVKNTYPLWLYPDEPVADSESINKISTISEDVIAKIAEGGNWLWTPDFQQIEDISHDGLFMADYWSYSMFKKICENNNNKVSPGTLGLFIHEAHPALEGFPTECHTNWQWFNIVKNSRPLKVAELQLKEANIVETIDNMWRHDVLSLIFEFRIGMGKILCTSIDFDKILDKPEARALLNSLSKYIHSDKFEPATELSAECFKKWVQL